MWIVNPSICVAKKFQPTFRLFTECNTLAVWLNRYPSRPGLRLWLNVKNLQLYKVINLKYMIEIFDIWYEIITKLNIKPAIEVVKELKKISL